MRGSVSVSWSISRSVSGSVRRLCHAYTFIEHHKMSRMPRIRMTLRYYHCYLNRSVSTYCDLLLQLGFQKISSISSPW